MPRNIEIKARLRSRDQVEAAARQLASQGPENLDQEDVFFPCHHGRLKLRIFSPDHAELIHYQRPDHQGPTTSHYRIVDVADPRGMRDVLATTLGEGTVVRKTRTIYLIGRTRLHLDTVESLGEFMELEVVLQDLESPEEGEAEARKLMAEFGVTPEDLVGEAYVDLLEQADRPLNPEH